MRASNSRGLTAAIVLAITVGYGHQAQANGFGGPGLVAAGVLIIGGGIGLSVANLGTTVAEIGYIAQGKRSPSLAGASFAIGTLGLLGGGLVVGLMDPDDEGFLRPLGIATLVVSSLNIVLAATQLARPVRERDSMALAPVTLVDASGELTVGAGITGRF